MNVRCLLALTALAIYPAAGCGGTSEHDETDSASASAEAQRGAGPVELNRYALSSTFTRLDARPAGIAADEAWAFIGSPLEGRVQVVSRRTGRLVADLPLPPNGFALPFVLHSIGRGKVAVLDAGGLPSPNPFVPANPTIYEYAYTGSNGADFSARLTRTVSFASALIGFAEDFVAIGGGRYLLSDAVLGAIWVAEADGTIRPGIVPKSADPGDAIPELKVCPTMPEVQVDGVPFLFSGATIPGVSPMALRGGTIYFYSPCAGGLYSVPLASFSDGRKPHQRARDIRLVSAKPRNVAVEELLALTFDDYDVKDPYLYAANALELEVLRIDTRTGVRQVLGRKTKLFNFPASLAPLPDAIGSAALLVVSNQQHRTPLTNAAISDDISELPFVVTRVDVF